MHPPSPINLGEVWTKQIYEAVRSSPQWNNTLFIITFDEHGVCNNLFSSQYSPIRFILHRGFPTMSLHPLASRTLTAWPILKLLLMARTIPSTLPVLGSGTSPFENIEKDFLRTNLIYLSVPTILISPWVGKAVIEHEGPNNGRTYTHSSIPGFISKAKPFIFINYILILMD